MAEDTHLGPLQAACLFSAVTLGYWNLPASVIAKASTLEIYDSASVPQGVPNLLST